MVRNKNFLKNAFFLSILEIVSQSYWLKQTLHEWINIRVEIQSKEESEHKNISYLVWPVYLTTLDMKFNYQWNIKVQYGTFHFTWLAVVHEEMNAKI